LAHDVHLSGREAKCKGESLWSILQSRRWTLEVGTQTNFDGLSAQLRVLCETGAGIGKNRSSRISVRIKKLEPKNPPFAARKGTPLHNKGWATADGARNHAAQLVGDEHQSLSKLRLCLFHVDHKRGTRPAKFGFDGIEVRACGLELRLADDAAPLT
jgi:hypothetical protein